MDYLSRCYDFLLNYILCVKKKKKKLHSHSIIQAEMWFIAQYCALVTQQELVVGGIQCFLTLDFCSKQDCVSASYRMLVMSPQ